MNIPKLSSADRFEGLQLATQSSRRRYAKVLHEPGALDNRVFNFMMSNSYMRPHLHPGPEKIENIHIVEGRVRVLFFDDWGAVTSRFDLGPESLSIIAVPAFTWHTYVIMTDFAITYETMWGIYEPNTWKQFAKWAPAEFTNEATDFLLRISSG